MRIYSVLLISALTFLISSSNAQNTYPYPSTGSVGIGTSSPTELLHVSGGAILAERNGATADFPHIRLFNSTAPTDYPGEKRADIYLDNITGQLVLRNVTQKGYRFTDASGSVPWLNLAFNGYIGVGVATPQAKFHVAGGAQFDEGAWIARSGNGAPTVALKLGQTNASGGIPNVTITTEDASGQNMLNLTSSRWSHVVNFRKGSETGDRTFIQFFSGAANRLIVFASDGTSQRIRLAADETSYFTNSLCIGTVDPKGYKLAVAGNMIAEKVKVKIYSGWPDYVFDFNYKLQPLSEIEAFIKKNKHLPGIPSAVTVEKEGIDVGDTQALLLKKIEEMTLHLIELNKKVEQMEEQNKILLQQVNK